MNNKTEAAELCERAGAIADLKTDFSKVGRLTVQMVAIDVDVLRELIRKYESAMNRGNKPAAGILTPLLPNSRAEWELEMEVFDMINNNPHPQRADMVNLLQKLWSEIVAREAWLTEYVIYSPNEFATSNEKGFWNQDKFWWDTIDNATSFEEVPAVLPPALGNDARAVLKRQAAEHIG